MPIYTYRCENCGIQFEQQQRFSDPPLVRCPECKKNALRKVYTPVGIVFKGSGFYATDHRSPSGAGRSTHAAEKDGDKNNQKPEPAKAEASTTNSSNGESQ
ncbi:MAG: FmdB family zinc ribbon protein [Anaerolineales bacterium]